MKALVGAFNQEKALVGAFSVIVQPVVEPMELYTALVLTVFLCVGAAGPGCGCRLRWPGEDTGQVSSSRSGDLATSGPRDTASADESWMEDQL